MKKRIDFIICYNKPVFLDECLYYINMLDVPEGFLVNVLTNEGAHSMASGYNEVMKMSDADIKIYMHQDVFIINPHFLFDIIDIFESDPKIGMIGMVGYKKVNDNAVMWREKRVGDTSYYKPWELVFPFDVRKDINDVAIIDGLMMVTSKDIEWDERFDAWDFYDASQSMRFLQNGYRIVVPNQKNTWTIHDDGKYLAVFDYGKYRDLFLNLYDDCIGKTAEEIRNH